VGVLVNPPPLIRIPDQFFNDPETRFFFEQQQKILFQLWNRTGGSNDSVAGKQIVIVTSSDQSLDTFGALIVVEADSNAVQITLPPITANTVGETVDVAIIDATFDTTIAPAGSETIFGDSSVIMNQQFMSIQYTAISEDVWIGT